RAARKHARTLTRSGRSVHYRSSSCHEPHEINTETKRAIECSMHARCASEMLVPIGAAKHVRMDSDVNAPTISEPFSGIRGVCFAERCGAAFLKERSGLAGGKWGQYSRRHSTIRRQ